MNAKELKRQLSAACHLAYVRLALNEYIAYEVFREGKRDGETDKRLAPIEKRYFDCLRAFLAGGGEEKSLREARALATREMEIVTAYTDRFQAYEYVMNRLEGRFGPQAAGRKGTDLDELMEELAAYIRGGQSAVGINGRIRDVISQLPVRLTRATFFALLRRGLSVYEGAPREGLDTMLYVLRSEGLLVRPEGMEEAYGDLRAILEQFRTADYRELTAPQFRELADSLARAGERLKDITGDEMLLMDRINDLCILVLSRQYAVMDAALERECRLILEGLLALFGDGTRPEISQEITDRLGALEGKQESYLEQWMAGGAAEPEDEESELGRAMRRVQELLSGSSFMELGEDETDGHTTSQAELSSEEERLEAEFTAAFASQPKVLTRAVMAKCLSSLPVFFDSFEEALVFMRGSFESCDDEWEREGSIRMLRMMMNEEEEQAD